MSTSTTSGSRLRTRWSAIGAAIAVTLGAGGIGFAQAAGDSGDQPVTVTVDAERILDTRIDLGLTGPFVQDTPRDVQVTGAVDVATDTGTDTKTVVPDGATAVLVNVTVVFPTDQGFLTLRSADAAGAPSTSTVNFQAGSVEPNAATVDLSADGKLQVWVFMPDAAATADVLIDVVGYTVDHDHDDRYYTQDQVDAEITVAANQLSSLFGDLSDAPLAGLTDVPAGDVSTTVASTSFTAPPGSAGGFLVVIGTVEATALADPGSGLDYLVDLQANGSTFGRGIFSTIPDTPSDEGLRTDNSTLVHVVPIGADQTVDLDLSVRVFDAESGVGVAAGIVAIYSPFSQTAG